jgi:membrane-associated phospholipid phosphatase
MREWLIDSNWPFDLANSVHTQVGGVVPVLQVSPGITDALRYRGIGVVSVLSSLPSVVIVFFAAVTQLADPWFVFSVLSILYIWPAWGIQRAEAARLFSLSLLAAALVLTLKVGFAVPRPPGSSVATVPGWLPWPVDELFHRVAASDGFGFPSGHATGGVVLYGGLAAVLEWGRRRTRVAIAVVLALAVMCSRLVLGVHFLVDVVAGGVLGSAILWIGLRRGTPTHVFGVATVVAIVGGILAASQGYPAETHDAAIGAGSAVGGAIGWKAMRLVEESQTVAIRPVTGLISGGVAASAWTAAYVVGGSLLEVSGRAVLLPLLASAVTAGVAIALIVGLPAVLLRWERASGGSTERNPP